MLHHGIAPKPATPAVEQAYDPAADVRRWLLENHAGVLGTVNAGDALEGWPFLSVAPFALDARGHLLFQMADIAQHTRNAKADPRVSFLVQEANTSGDPQRGWRITLLGKLAPVAPGETEEMLARFAERTPAAYEYATQHHFGMYRMEVERVRYIGGFGRIHWVNGADVLREPHGAGLAEAATPAVEHMNADHGATLIEMCEGLQGFKPNEAKMVQLDRAGFLVRTAGPDRLVHFSFGKEITAESLRFDVIGVLKRARAKKTEAPR